MTNDSKAKYMDLVDTWWKTADVLDARPPANDTRVSWHAHVFEKILIQCGWSVQEWNETIEIEKAKRKVDDNKESVR